MSEPTTSIFLSASTPAPSSGFQDVVFQSDGGTPQQKVSAQVPSTGGAVVKTASYTLTAADCGKLIVANSATAITFTLPAAIPFGQWEVRIANIGIGALSVAPGGSLTLDGGTTAVSVSQWQGLSIATDGTNYFSTRGIGGSSANATEIQGVGVSTTAPTNGQVLEYDSASGLYVPATPPVTVAFIIPDGSTGTDVALQDSAARAGSVKQCVVTVSASDGAVDLTFKMKQNAVDVFSADPTIAAGAAAGSKFTFATLTSNPLAIAAGDIFSMDISSGSSSWKFIGKLE